MTQPIQCENCGAVLLKEDVFCGECGAPRPEAAPGTELPVAPQPAPVAAKPVALPPPLPTVKPTRSPRNGWRVTAIVLGGLALLCCLLGIVAFLLFGMTPTEGYSESENWALSAVICLLPIAGTGGVLAVIAAIIWRTQLRGRNAP